MAKDNNVNNPLSDNMPKKADVILQFERGIFARQEKMMTRLEDIFAKISESHQESVLLSRQNGEIYDSIKEEYESVKREIKYLAVQNENVYRSVTEKVEKLSQELGRVKVRKFKGNVPVVAESAEVDIDYDLIAEKVARLVGSSSVQAAAVSESGNGGAAVSLNYDVLADKIIERMPVGTSKNGTLPINVSAEVDYDALAAKVAEYIPVPKIDTDEIIGKFVERIPVQEPISADAIANRVAEQIVIPEVPEVDYELIADTVVERIPVQEPVSADAIANRVAEQIVIPEVPEVDYELIADTVVERIPVQEAPHVEVPEVDYELIADKVEDRIGTQDFIAPEVIADRIIEQLVMPEVLAPEIDYDKFASKVSQNFPIQLTVSPELIANKVAEQFKTASEAAFEVDYEELASKVAERISGGVSETALADGVAVSPEFDYDVIADKLAARMSGSVASLSSDGVTPVAEVNYDILAEKVAERIPSREINAEIDYELLAEKVAERIPQSAAEAAVADVAAVEVDYDAIADKLAARVGGNTVIAAPAGVADVDYDMIADKVVARFPVQETVSPDFIASKVAEQIVLPESGNVEINYELLADKVAERIPASQEVVNSSSVEVDYELLADKVASRIVVPALDLEELNVELNEDELADKIAAKVGTIKADDIEILVDNEGCNNITKEIAEKLDYDRIASALAERMSPAFGRENAGEPDYEELAVRIGERIPVTEINEDSIAEKAAAAVSERLPEIDTDAIAEKVANQVISALPSVDNEVIGEAVSRKVIESQSDKDYEIVLDENGINEVSVKISEANSVRFNDIDKGINEIKELLESGVSVVRQSEFGVSESFNEPYSMEESLVTVSDLINDTPAEDNSAVKDAGTAEEAEDDAALPPVIVEETINNSEIETQDEDDDENGEETTLQEFVVNEKGDVEVVASVDFANMMRYNRSFISRIIQGTDEQKNYYGTVRSALLSYKKVNSNIAWGAERFHKGRETIARFKIRGRTLVLYLALDPKEHPVSVYHHKDVSGNKSVAGTPMMIKVKSPLGVKKAIRLVDEMLLARGGIKRPIPERDYAQMYPYESTEELIQEGLIKNVRKDK